MAEVVRLAPGESPREGGKWVLVHTEEAVRAPGVNITLHTDGATFSVSPDEAESSGVVAQASEWADAHGVPTVYVRW